MVKISVIVPSCNSIRYYRECMDSILGQTEKGIEVIPVDAGSMDGTWELICDYAKADTRVHPVRSEQKSYGYQCNLGIRTAKGEYVAIVESDDYIVPNMYERLCQAAKENQLDWVKSDFDFFVDLEERFFLHYSVLPSTKRDGYRKVRSFSEDLEVVFRDLNLWNGIYKKDFLEKEGIQFQETKGAAFQDISFVLQTLMLAKRFMYLPGESYCYRQDNQASSIYNPAGLRYVWDEFQYMERFLKRNAGHCEGERAVVLKKLFRDMKGACGRAHQLMELKAEDRECIYSFQEHFKTQYNRLSVYERLEQRLPLNIYMDLFMNDLESFDWLIHWERGLIRNVRESLIKIAKENQVVIAGAGEWGSGLFAFLRNNGVDSVLAFCDNAPALSGKEHMGLKVINMEEACLCWREAVFFIASGAYYCEIKKQLLALGIEKGKIARSPMIPLHEALEDRILEGKPL